LSDNSDTGRAQRLQQSRDFLSQLATIPRHDLSEQEQITADILELDFQSNLEGEKFNFHYWAIDQLNGIQVGFPTLLQNFHPKKTTDDWQSLLKRAEGLSTKMANYLA